MQLVPCDAIERDNVRSYAPLTVITTHFRHLSELLRAEQSDILSAARLGVIIIIYRLETALALAKRKIIYARESIRTEKSTDF
jgi:hypothetical protein